MNPPCKVGARIRFKYSRNNKGKWPLEVGALGTVVQINVLLKKLWLIQVNWDHPNCKLNLYYPADQFTVENSPEASRIAGIESHNKSCLCNDADFPECLRPYREQIELWNERRGRYGITFSDPVIDSPPKSFGHRWKNL